MRLPPFTPRSGVTRVVLLRHAEPDIASGRVYGRLDIPLSQAGLATAARSAEALLPHPFSAIYASPLTRARQTAEIVAGSRTQAFQTIPGLEEIDLGQVEGLTRDEIVLRFPELYHSWMERPYEVMFPSGESFACVRQRVLPLIKSLRAAHDGEAILLVAHAGVNRVTLADALGMPSSCLFRLDQSYCAVNIIDYFGDAPVVKLMNGCARG
ncbi:MAG: histidine phosphatase family protein [Deltaproteobacteria bacterium]|nr:histidine phosphatase family protein [Deltaproteobacteria bacterium]